MSKEDYSKVGRTPLARIRELPSDELVAYLEQCSALVRMAVYRSLLAR